MKAMLLIYNDEATWERMRPAEKGAIFGAYRAYSEALREAGAFLGGAPLQHTGTAQLVRVRDGAPQVLDGPYAETKEQLGGYYLIEAPDMEAAARWAARCPAAAYGTVEVRPVLDMAGMATG